MKWKPKIFVFLLAWLMVLFNPFGKKTHLVIQSDPFKGLRDLQLGDERVTLNHLACRFVLGSKPFNEICANRPLQSFQKATGWDKFQEKFHTMKNDTPWKMIRSCTVCFLYDTNDSYMFPIIWYLYVYVIYVSYTKLVGGWTNPFDKKNQIGSFPEVGVNTKKNIWNHHPDKWSLEHDVPF